MEYESRKLPNAHLIYMKPNRTRSVPSPLAQDATLCEVSSSQVADIIKATRLLLANQNERQLDRAVVELLMINGCRISEALRITPSCIDNLGNITIKVSKGKHKRHIVSSSYKEFWINYKFNNCTDLQYTNRFYYYRLLKKHGIQLLAKNGMNYAVTHAFRNLLINVVDSNPDDLQAVQAFITHKSINSTKHYHDKKIKGSH